MLEMKMYCLTCSVEQFGGEPHLAGLVAGVVDDDVPVAALERIDLPVAIA